MGRELSNAALTLTMVAILSVAHARDRDDDALTFSWTAEEICLVGPPGTFTPGGDITNFPNQIPAWGSGVITFHPATSSAIDTGTWMFFLPVFFLQQPPGTPQGLFPARTSAAECVWTLQNGDGLSWTLEAPRTGCSGTDTSGPGEGTTIIFTDGAKVRGQFAADMQSFIAHRKELIIENGSISNGNQLQRICMRNMQGVRLQKQRK